MEDGRKERGGKSVLVLMMDDGSEEGEVSLQSMLETYNDWNCKGVM